MGTFVVTPAATWPVARSAASLSRPWQQGPALGAFAGRVAAVLYPQISPVDSAVIGAASVLAVTQGALITAVAIILELLHGGLALLGPIVVATVLGIDRASLLDYQLCPVWWEDLTGSLPRRPNRPGRCPAAARHCAGTSGKR